MVSLQPPPGPGSFPGVQDPRGMNEEPLVSPICLFESVKGSLLFTVPSFGSCLQTSVWRKLLSGFLEVLFFYFIEN